MKAALKKWLFLPLVMNVLIVAWLIYINYFSDEPTDFFGVFLFLILGSLFIYDIFVGLLFLLFRTVIHFHEDKIERFENAVYTLFVILLIVPFFVFYYVTS